MLNSSHPGPIPHLRPIFVGSYYVQPTVEYLAGQGFTTKAVRNSWDVRTRDTNELIMDADTKAGAVAGAEDLTHEA
jgi:hypothetical protein